MINTLNFLGITKNMADIIKPAGTSLTSTFQKFIPGPPMVPVADTLRAASMAKNEYSAEFSDLFKQAGILGESLTSMIGGLQQVNYERGFIYREVEHATNHWLVGAAMEVFADYATQHNSAVHNASVWVTSQSHQYSDILYNFLEMLDLEERIYDWAWTTGTYGDLFIRAYGAPGQGILAIEDDKHPSSISRVDYMGGLIGFADTPYGASGQVTEQSMLPPWEYVHSRLLGAKKRRSFSGEPLQTEYRSAYMMSPDTRQLTTKYGTSLILNALPVYKRLRISEDSLLLARLTRGYQKYIYKLGVSGKNPDAVAMMTQTIMQIVKRARAWDTTQSGANFASRSNVMNVMEDLFIPIFGSADDLKVESIGADPNIKWITDVQELRNQLAASLRVSLPLLGAYVEESSGTLGSDSIEQLDIRFARTSRRLQRAVKVSIKRLCQIHLAYKGYDADPSLFDINMTETSSAEENQVKEALQSSLNVATSFLELMDTTEEKIDIPEVINYLNRVFIKLDDFNMSDYIKNPSIGESKKHQLRETLIQAVKDIMPKDTDKSQIAEKVNYFLNNIKDDSGFVKENTLKSKEFTSALPYSTLNVPYSKKVMALNEWNSNYAGKQVKVQNVNYTPAMNS
jgi:hypothetical protein